MDVSLLIDWLSEFSQDDKLLVLTEYNSTEFVDSVGVCDDGYPYEDERIIIHTKKGPMEDAGSVGDLLKELTLYHNPKCNEVCIEDDSGNDKVIIMPPIEACKEDLKYICLVTKYKDNIMSNLGNVGNINEILDEPKEEPKEIKPITKSVSASSLNESKSDSVSLTYLISTIEDLKKLTVKEVTGMQRDKLFNRLCFLEINLLKLKDVNCELDRDWWR